MGRRQYSAYLTALGFVLSATAAIRADVTYQITDLGDLGGGSSFAGALSDNGSVVGYTALGGGSITSFLWNASTGMTNLGWLSPNNSNAWGISADGSVVAGRSYVPSGNEAYVWTSAQGMQGLGWLPGLSQYGAATGVSGDGSSVVGLSATGANSQGFIWSKNTGMTGIGSLPGAIASVVNGNAVIGSNAIAVSYDGSRIVGTSTTSGGNVHAIEYSNGAMVDLGTLVGDRSSLANAINSTGQVVGFSTPAQIDHTDTATGSYQAFVDNNGTMKPLGTLGGSSSDATAINNRGQIVGYSNISGNAATHAFISNGTSMTDLNALLAPSSGWTLNQATAINSAGQIVGQGINSSGNSHAFLLTPTNLLAPPLPPTIDPTNPPVQFQQDRFVAGIQPSLSWTPLTVGADFELNIPGLDGIPKWHPTMNFPSQPLTSSIPPWQVSFAPDNGFEKAVLNALTPQSWNALTATGTVTIKGGLSAQGGITFHDGSSNMTIDAGFSLGVTVNGELALSGGLKNIPGLGNLIPSSLAVEIPVPGAALDFPTVTFGSIPIGQTFNYEQFTQAITNITHLPIPSEGTVTVDGVDITFDQTKAQVFVGLSAEANLFASSSATFSLDAYLRKDSDTSATSTLASTGSDGLSKVSLASSPHVTSSTGTVTLTSDGTLNLKTGSPVWINSDLTIDHSFNAVVFDAQFDATDQGDGVVGVYLDGNLIGLIDEATAGHAIQSYLFNLVSAQSSGEHVLGFRMDPQTSLPATVSISNVSTDFSATPEPMSFGILALGLTGLFIRRR